MTGTKALTATATDAVGVQSVSFQRSPAGAATWTQICLDATTAYTCSFDTTAVTDGSYDLRAVALDTAGNQSISTVAARVVDNPPRGVDVQTTNVGGGTAGLLQTGDTISLTWSEPILPASVLAGWTGASQAIRVSVANSASNDQMDFLTSTRCGPAAARPERDRPQARRQLRDHGRDVQRDDGPQRQHDHRHARLEDRGHRGHGRRRHDDVAAVGDRHRRLGQAEHDDDGDRVRHRRSRLLMRAIATLLTSLAMALTALGLAFAAPGGPKRVGLELQSASGAVHIANSRDGQAVFSAAGMRPGEGVSGTVRIGNDGDASGAFTVRPGTVEDTPGPNGGLLSTRVQLVLFDVTDVQHPVTIYAGPPAGLQAVALGTLAPGHHRDYLFAATLPDSGLPGSPPRATTSSRARRSASASSGAQPRQRRLGRRRPRPCLRTRCRRPRPPCRRRRPRRHAHQPRAGSPPALRSPTHSAYRPHARASAGASSRSA